MAGLLDYLMGVAGGGPAAAPQTQSQADPQDPMSYIMNQAAAPADPNAAPTQATDPSDPTSSTVAPLAITASRSTPLVSSQGSSTYDNTPELGAIQNVLAKYPSMDNQSGGNSGDNLGLSNMISGMGHPGGGFTLRNILGTLGDAFLISSGHQPIHAQQAYNQQIANAAAGFDTDPSAAAARVAATGAPGSLETATSMYNAAQQLKLRQAQEEQNNWYRQNTVQNRQDAQATRLTPYAGAILNDPSIKTKEDYQKAYDRVNTMYGRIGKDYSAADAGAVDPDDWQPSTQQNLGMTAGQVARNNTSGASIQERAGASQLAHSDRMANIAAANRRAAQAASSRLPTQGSILSSLISKQNSGQQLTPAEQAVWNEQTQGKGHKGITIPNLVPGSGGNARPVPTASDLSYVRLHPEARAAFQAHFGIAPQ